MKGLMSYSRVRFVRTKFHITGLFLCKSRRVVPTEMFRRKLCNQLVESYTERKNSDGCLKLRA